MAPPPKSECATVAIAATFTAEPLVPSLQFVLREVGLTLDVRCAPYHQVFQELLSPQSLLNTNSGGVNVVLVRLEDFARDIIDLDEAVRTLRATARELADTLSQYVQNAAFSTVFAAMRPSPRIARELCREIEAANGTLVAHAQTLPGVILLTEGDIEQVASGDSYDAAADEIAHMPFTEDQYASIALAIGRKVHASRVPAHKVLVLDCDETLWRGVVGEDGVEGITISPGKARLQRFAVEIQAQGALVCLVSKNTERDVLEVFAKRSDMTLRLEHIVAHRINWEPKPRNLSSLADELNLGLDAFVFIDDNPIECGAMRAELPQVLTLQLPPDDEIESFLNHLWVFDKVAVTDEDSRRTSMYRSDAARRRLEDSAVDVRGFIASLNLLIEIAAPEETEWPRLAQLTQRTNQFNFSTKRCTEVELRGLAKNAGRVLSVKVRDRFGDYGVVGLTVAAETIDALTVDTLLLSCRVLGRGVEHAILRRLGQIAEERGLATVDLTYVPTAKNEPARAFAESVGVEFRVKDEDRTIYKIPVAHALSFCHQPGRNQAATVQADSSVADTSSAMNTAECVPQRCEGYTRLAQTLVSGQRVLDAARSSTAGARRLPGRPTAPDTYMERELLILWQQLLAIKKMGVEDDYFALGGTSLLTARMMAEISRRFGVKLPLTVILESPTVRALSRHLQQERNPRSDVLVELKPGGPRNLFLVHDGNGETLLYLNLARRMPAELAVFGIEPRRLTRMPLAHATIADMASFYLERIRKRQPQGPYLLGGMCAGGVIAYEMASQLAQAGERVELLALLDAAKPGAPMRRGRVTRQRFDRLRQAIAEAQKSGEGRLKRVGLITRTAVQKASNTLLWKVSDFGKRWSMLLRFRLLRELLRRDLEWPKFVPELNPREVYNLAEAGYLPKKLSIPHVVLVRAQNGEGNDTPFRDIYVGDNLGWDDLAEGLTTVDVEGGHSTMLQEGFIDSLAQALLPYVQGKSPEVDDVILLSNSKCGSAAALSI
jgi:FkbH-like protein